MNMWISKCTDDFILPASITDRYDREIHEVLTNLNVNVQPLSAFLVWHGPFSITNVVYQQVEWPQRQ